MVARDGLRWASVPGVGGVLVGDVRDAALGFRSWMPLVKVIERVR